MTTKRLFLALMPSDAERTACHRVARELSTRMQPGTPVLPAENLHLTLMFLGAAVTTEQETAIRQVASLVAGDPMEFTLSTANSFPAASAWWLGLKEVPPSLIDLRTELYRRISDCGISLERSRFVPHVTVIKSPRKLPPTMIQPIVWCVSDFVLVQSTPGTDAPIYTVIGRWSLNGAQRRPAQSEQISLL